MTSSPTLRKIAPLGVLTALLLAGCAPSPSSTPDGAAAGAGAFQHIHALTVDPDQGDLLVATHEGLYRLVVAPDGSATGDGPAGGLDFDPMGFTLSGDVAFASGHPGPTTPSSFGSPNMGLIRSEDGGETWTNISLTGQTDFHALSVAPSAEDGSSFIYGLDSSTPTLRRSFDGGLTWSDGAQLVARDVLADPTRPGTVYATTENGFALSTDEGATFAVDAAAPRLFLLSSAGPGLLAGIDTSGVVWHEEATGAWVAGGSVTGTPQAMTVSGDRLYVADDRGIAVSDDWGASWTAVDVSL